MLICVIATYNEQEMIGRAIGSALEAGCDSVHVFDGGWDDYAEGASTDHTVRVAELAGATVHGPLATTQAEKRTLMFHLCDATDGDMVLSLDADETLDGRFPEGLPLEHHHVWLQNMAPNDMPGVRLDWPWGDAGTVPFPLLRLFAYSPGLACYTGGVWTENGKLIQPYDDAANPLLPIVPGMRILHHAHERSPERIERKRAFYRAEHARRRNLKPL